MANTILERGSRLRRRMGISAGALMALFLVGCGPSKVAQCNQLAEVVNQPRGLCRNLKTEIQTFSENASQVKKPGRH